MSSPGQSTSFKVALTEGELRAELQDVNRQLAAASNAYSPTHSGGNAAPPAVPRTDLLRKREELLKHISDFGSGHVNAAAALASDGDDEDSPVSTPQSLAQALSARDKLSPQRPSSVEGLHRALSGRNLLKTQQNSSLRFSHIDLFGADEEARPERRFHLTDYERLLCRRLALNAVTSALQHCDATTLRPPATAVAEANQPQFVRSWSSRNVLPFSASSARSLQAQHNNVNGHNNSNHSLNGARGTGAGAGAGGAGGGAGARAGAGAGAGLRVDPGSSSSSSEAPRVHTASSPTVVTRRPKPQLVMVKQSPRARQGGSSPQAADTSAARPETTKRLSQTGSWSSRVSPAPVPQPGSPLRHQAAGGADSTGRKKSNSGGGGCLVQ